jgi:hypothetical protein
MPLPSSGQISFNDVRIEVSQSVMTDYRFGRWSAGLVYQKEQLYAPINVLSSGSRWSLTNRLQRSNLSMSAWYGNNHNLSIPTGVTGTLYSHANPYSFDDNLGNVSTQTMLPIELGTSNATYSINVSGSVSASVTESIDIYYGKPWNNNGTDFVVTTSASYVTGTFNFNGSFTYNYNYTYNAASGSKIYVIIRAER